MKLKIFMLIALCSQFKSDLCSQNTGLRGIATDKPLTEQFQFIPYTGTTSAPENSPRQQVNPGVVRGTQSQVVDSLLIEDIIPAGATYLIKYDHLTNTFTKLPAIPDLTPDAVAAINSSPKWLRNDLYDNLRRLDTTLQNEYAQVIMEADPLYRDEVAFQVAHLSTNMELPTLNRFIPLINAQGIYQNAPGLQYVKLVEHGSVSEGDWHTTTSYRIINESGDTVWSEVPREIYYWWVLMPIVYEESPRIDSTVFNEFWRTYVYENADSGYPVLKNVLADVKVYWDGRSHHWENHDSFGQNLAFGDSLTAVEALGRWVAHTITEDAIAPRPSQPNQALHDHNGNCGEIQGLQTSGGRAGLIPLMTIASLPGDHVWNEVYWPDSAKWAFYQVARVGGPTDVSWSYQWPTSSCITALRADGYRWMVNEHYNPVCTVTVVVTDNYAKPVDGAEVVFLSTPYFDTHSLAQSVIGSWGHTDENGQLTVLLGTDFNYFIRADWAEGHTPPNPTLFHTLQFAALSPGGHKWIYVNNGENTAADVANTLVPTLQPTQQSIEVEYEVPYHVTYGGSFWNYPLWQDDFLYAYKREGGSLSAFICDDENKQKYTNSIQFDAYASCDSLTTGNMSVDIDGQQDIYIGLSNKSKQQLAEFTRIKISRYDGPNSFSSKEGRKEMKLYPNPSNGIFYLTDVNTREGDASLEVVNTVGDMVYKTALGRNETQKELNLSALSKGVYLLRISTKESAEVKKLIIQ